MLSCLALLVLDSLPACVTLELTFEGKDLLLVTNFGNCHNLFFRSQKTIYVLPLSLECATSARACPIGLYRTSITDKAGRKPLMVGLPLMIVLRLTSIAGMDPPDMTVTFFGIIPPPRDVATVVPVSFA